MPVLTVTNNSFAAEAVRVCCGHVNTQKFFDLNGPRLYMDGTIFY